jgi:hypothetical protein
MFKLYTIVLAALVSLTAILFGLELYQNGQHSDELAVIAAECDSMFQGTDDWDDKCNVRNPHSDISRKLNIIDITGNRAVDFAKYTGYLLLLMLVSGVLRLIWNGRNKSG